MTLATNGFDHAAATTSTRCTRIRTLASTAIDCAAVVPVVSTSSTSTTAARSSCAPRSALRRIRIAPDRFTSRAEAERPAESRAHDDVKSSGSAAAFGPSSAAAALDSAVTGSPPRRRADILRVGAGTRINRSELGRSDHRSMVRRATASACPIGAARSRRPCSFNSRTACRRCAVYRPRAYAGTGSDTLVRSSMGSSANRAEHRRHQRAPATPHPPQIVGITRSARAPAMFKRIGPSSGPAIGCARRKGPILPTVHRPVDHQQIPADDFGMTTETSAAAQVLRSTPSSV